jgi:Zn-dependent metalloprotease
VSATGQTTLLGTQVLQAQRSLLSSIGLLGVPTGGLQRTIYDAGGLPVLPGRLVRSEGSADVADVSVNEAYAGAGETYRFFDEVFGRKSLDDRGFRLDGTVHYREDPAEPFDNAFWNGEQMVYGDGDGLVFGPFTRSLDVIAHELTHGVTQFEANFEYHKQPGALNESFSDVFGSMVKQWHLNQSIAEADWLIGAELLLPGVNGVAIRSLKAPGTAYDDAWLGTDPQPDRMSNYVQLPDTRRGDWGGVHVNSGIPNRAFYLACQNLGVASSWERAGQIWYVALRSLPSTSVFADAAMATITIAEQAFGAEGRAAVQAAWQEVEVVPRAALASVPR